MFESLKAELVGLTAGSIAVCKRPGTRHHALLHKIISATSFLPPTTTISWRVFFIRSGMTEWPKCKCGCNELLKDPRSDFLPSHGNRSKEVQEKKKQTWLKKYGVDNPSKAAEVELKKALKRPPKKIKPPPVSMEERLRRTRETSMEKYGVPYFLCRKDIDRTPKDPKQQKAKSKETRRISAFDNLNDGQNIIPMFTKEDIIARGSNVEYMWKCKRCSKTFTHLYNYPWLYKRTCPFCEPVSKDQLDLKLFVESLGLEVNENDRMTLAPAELDILVKSKNIAIEYNGLHWHCGVDKAYHLGKTTQCEDLGIRLIHVFEDEWNTKRKIVKRRLKHILGCNQTSIYGRECEIRSIESKPKAAFLEKYHIQGNCSSSINLGAYYEDCLVAVMTFGKLRPATGRHHIEGHWELSRFCTIGSINVIGVAGKLLKHFERTQSPLQVISYADRRWSQGMLYKNLGFNLDHISDPNYWYVKNKLRHHRINFMKSKLKEKLLVFDPDLTEIQNMKNNKYDRIWDCGNLVFKKTYEIS